MDEGIQQAREQLASDDHRVRMYALALLAQRDDIASAPLIVPLLQDVDHRVRVEALHTLARFQYHEALPRIIELLRDRETLVRAAAASALGAVRDPNGFEALVVYLDSGAPDTVYRAAITALMHYDDPRRVTLLISALQRFSGVSFGCDIIATLAATPSAEVVDALIQATKTAPDDDVRAAAAVALGTIGDTRAIPALEYMAANDAGENWLLGSNGWQANAITAEEAIQAVHARVGALEQLSISAGRTDGQVPIWRHRMPDYTDCRKVFVERRRDREGDLNDDAPDELIARVEVRFIRPRIGVLGTITVEWFGHESRHKVPEDPVPVIHIPWTAWGALPYCGGLLERLGHAQGPAMQSGAFCDLLRQEGFEDQT